MGQKPAAPDALLNRPNLTRSRRQPAVKLAMEDYPEIPLQSVSAYAVIGARTK